MSVIRLTATAGPDGVLHLSVPVGTAGDFEVTVVATPSAAGAKPKTSEELGWPPGFLENTFGSIDDEKFVAPPRPPAEPLPPWDEE